MSCSEWCTHFVLPKCIVKVFDSVPNDTKLTIHFKSESTLKLKFGFQSDILVGRIVCTDKHGNSSHSKPLLLKIFPEALARTSFTEVTFQNEIFVYNKVLPFFATVNESILHLFPKFYHARMDFDEKEDGIIVMENLMLEGYQSMTSHVFMDIKHHLLVMRKLGEFHAYSYQAKKQDPKKFYSIVDCLSGTHWATIKLLPKATHERNEYFLQILSRDERYEKKIQKIRLLIVEADEFISKVFDSKEEPMAVICHGDFLRSNILCKYDNENNPVDVKFIDLGNMIYSTPVVDLGLILYLNTDQPTRNEYWDLLIETYYDSLKNTFPDNDLLPSKCEILSEFKHNVLQCYLIAAVFIPSMMAAVESNSSTWFKDLFEPEYVEYQNVSFTSIPEDIRRKIGNKMLTPHRVEKVLDVLRDIIDRGFV